MSLTRRLFAASAVAVTALTVASGAYAQEDKSLQNILDKKSIALGIPTDYPPYGTWALTSSPPAWTWPWRS